MKQEKDKRISEEKFWCIHCGMRFRYKQNKVNHEKKCAYFSPEPKFINPPKDL